MAARRQPARTERLGPDDWVAAALDAIATGGVGNVSVERLAAELGATKGSFYWHFKDRGALISAALTAWLAAREQHVIGLMAGAEGPRGRLAALMSPASLEHETVTIEAALTGDAGDPLVAEVLATLTRRRLRLLESIFREVDPDGYKSRALFASAAYLGWLQLLRYFPELVPKGSALKRYTDVTVDRLVAS